MRAWSWEWDEDDAAAGRGTTYHLYRSYPAGEGPWPEALFRLDLTSTISYYSPELAALLS